MYVNLILSVFSCTCSTGVIFVCTHCVVFPFCRGYRDHVEKEGALSVGSYSNEDGVMSSSLNEILSDYVVSREKDTCMCTRTSIISGVL